MSAPELGLLLLGIAGIVLLSCAAFGAYAGRQGVARRRFEEVVRALYGERSGIDRERRELAAVFERVRQDSRERQAAEAAADRRIRFLEGQVADLHRALLALQSQRPPRSHHTGEEADRARAS